MSRRVDRNKCSWLRIETCLSEEQKRKRRKSSEKSDRIDGAQIFVGDSNEWLVDLGEIEHGGKGGRESWERFALLDSGSCGGIFRRDDRFGREMGRKDNV